MRQQLAERIEYGRTIRERAECLLAAHGRAAEAEARLAARLAGAAAAERDFWDAVADRAGRHFSEPRWDPLF